METRHRFSTVPMWAAEPCVCVRARGGWYWKDYQGFYQLTQLKVSNIFLLKDILELVLLVCTPCYALFL